MVQVEMAMNNEVDVNIDVSMVRIDSRKMTFADDILEWLAENNIDWNIDFYYENLEETVLSKVKVVYKVTFTNEKDAMLFTLRWL